MAESLPVGGQEDEELDNCLRDKLGEVTAVFDMDGYTVDGVFKCKELGWKYIHHQQTYSFFFYHGGERELSTKDRFTADYVYQKIFDIPYGEFWPGMIKGEEVESMVDRLHSRGRVAYKGGRIEKDLLKSLRIPSIDLEELGCPKVDRLFIFKNCGLHKRGFHCPREEVAVLEWWMDRFLWEHNITTNLQTKVKNPFEFMSGSDFAFI